MNKSGNRLVRIAAFFNKQPINESEHPVKTKDRRETFVARNAQGSSKRHWLTNALVASHLTELSLKTRWNRLFFHGSFNSGCSQLHYLTCPNTWALLIRNDFTLLDKSRKLVVKLVKIQPFETNYLH